MKELKQNYIKIIKQLERGEHKDAVRLPKYVAPFQFKLYDCLKELTSLVESKSSYIYKETFDTKSCTNDISTISPSSTEAKTLINNSQKIRQLNKTISEIEADITLLEEMISTIKNHSFNLNIYIKGKELYE